MRQCAARRRLLRPNPAILQGGGVRHAKNYALGRGQGFAVGHVLVSYDGL